jgi:hypothetical protein
MKTEQVNSLYKLMTPKQLANMTIDAITNKSPDSELELIKDNIEKGLYRLPVWEYRNHLKGYEQLSFCYGLQFWKNIAKLNMCHEVMESGLVDAKVSSDCFAAYKIYAGRLISLDLALIELCNKAKFDINAVHWLAEVSETDKALYKPLIPCVSPYDLEHYRYMLHTAAMLEYTPDNGV